MKKLTKGYWTNTAVCREYGLQKADAQVFCALVPLMDERGIWLQNWGALAFESLCGDRMTAARSIQKLVSMGLLINGGGYYFFTDEVREKLGIKNAQNEHSDMLKMSTKRSVHNAQNEHSDAQNEHSDAQNEHSDAQNEPSFPCTPITIKENKRKIDNFGEGELSHGDTHTPTREDFLKENFISSGSENGVENDELEETRTGKKTDRSRSRNVSRAGGSERSYKPSWEEARDYCKSLGYPIRDGSVAMRWYSDRERKGWRINGEKMWSWKADFKYWLETDGYVPKKESAYERQERVKRAREEFEEEMKETKRNIEANKDSEE